MHRRAILATLILVVVGSTSAEAGPGHFWRSLAIPGWGQHASGNRSAAARFFAIEASLWAGYFGLEALSGIRRDTYRTWARTHAGADPTGKSGEYFDDLGFYVSQQQHNLFARVDDGPDAVLYPDEPSSRWEWDEDASRQRYRALRNAAETMERNALYVTGVVMVNHLVSAVHAARSTGATAQDDPPSWQLAFVDSRPALLWMRRF